MLKLCRECQYSMKWHNDHELRCKNPYVNARDHWALAASSEWGFTSCREERKNKWFSVCGMKGKKWEKKVD